MEKEKTLFEIIENGPLKVTGPFRLTGSDGKPITTDKEIFLCRCGHSSNKPFCDGSHRTKGFAG